MLRAVMLLLVIAAAAGCRERAEPSADSGPAPRETRLRLRHGFREGLELRYESSTVERGATEVTIDMRTRWRVTRIDEGGDAELEVTIERYEQRAFPPPPPAQVAPDVTALNRGLDGAQFLLKVSPDGRRIEHLGHRGLPPLSPAAVEGIKASIASHILRLPAEPVRDGQRWTIESPPPRDGGPAEDAPSSRSQWRVLSIRPGEGRDTLVELVCLSTVDSGPQQIGGRLVRNRTEFHYSYLWNATDGVLDSLSSTGSTTTTPVPPPDAGAAADREPEAQRTSFEARLRLLSRSPGAR